MKAKYLSGNLSVGSRSINGKTSVRQNAEDFSPTALSHQANKLLNTKEFNHVRRAPLLLTKLHTYKVTQPEIASAVLSLTVQLGADKP